MIDVNSSDKVILFEKITVMPMEWNKIIEIKSSDGIDTKACNLTKFCPFQEQDYRAIEDILHKCISLYKEVWI